MVELRDVNSEFWGGKNGIVSEFWVYISQFWTAKKKAELVAINLIIYSVASIDNS